MRVGLLRMTAWLLQEYGKVFCRKHAAGSKEQNVDRARQVISWMVRNHCLEALKWPPEGSKISPLGTKIAQEQEKWDQDVSKSNLFKHVWIFFVISFEFLWDFAISAAISGGQNEPRRSPRAKKRAQRVQKWAPDGCKIGNRCIPECTAFSNSLRTPF